MDCRTRVGCFILNRWITHTHTHTQFLKCRNGFVHNPLSISKRKLPTTSNQHTLTHEELVPTGYALILPSGISGFSPIFQEATPKGAWDSLMALFWWWGLSGRILKKNLAWNRKQQVIKRPWKFQNGWCRWFAIYIFPQNKHLRRPIFRGVNLLLVSGSVQPGDVEEEGWDAKGLHGDEKVFVGPCKNPHLGVHGS